MEERKVSLFAEKTALIISITIYVAVIIALAYLTDANIFVVFIGTLPVLLYLIVFFYFVRIDARMGLLWILPVIFPLIFLFIWYAKGVEILRQIDGPVIAVLDILISYVINIFVIFIFGIGRRIDKGQIRSVQSINQVNSQLNTLKSQLDDAHSKLAEAHSELLETKSKLVEAKKDVIVTKENFNITLRSIEDKCKAINFVIGRVYSEKRGANAEIRDKLKIDSHLYNSFSELTADFKSEDAEKLHSILSSIHQKILQMEHPENTLFKIHHPKLPVERDAEGNDKVIDVLVKNDKDPIADYYSEAKEICSKLMAFLNENYIKSNTYFTN